MKEANKKTASVAKLSFNKAHKKIKFVTARKLSDEHFMPLQAKGFTPPLAENPVVTEFYKEYFEAVNKFIEGLESAKKYKNLGLTVDSPALPEDV